MREGKAKEARMEGGRGQEGIEAGGRRGVLIEQDTVGEDFIPTLTNITVATEGLRISQKTAEAPGVLLVMSDGNDVAMMVVMMAVAVMSNDSVDDGHGDL
eukprot:1723753-Pyramimonas_sp.AAC.1